MENKTKKVLTLLFFGNILFIYLLVFFPNQNEPIVITDIVLGIVKSISISFAIILGIRITFYLDKKLKN